MRVEQERAGAARLAGKVAIITGAARGQGASHARQFVMEGASVVIADVLDQEGNELAESLGDAARYARLDVTSSESWASAVDVALNEFGPPSVLVNNAGILGAGRLIDLEVEDFKRTLDVNLTGAWLGLKHVVPGMISNGGGSVVNISSLAGHRARADVGSYVPSKWGLVGMSKAAALEVGPQGVRVNTVLPGYIETPMLGDRIDHMRRPEHWAGLAIPRLGRPEDITAAVVFLASDESGFCTGIDIVVDGGASIGYFKPAAER